jgi:exoribonuclease R
MALEGSNASTGSISDQCDLMNEKHLAAQLCGRASNELHSYLFFKRVGSKVCTGVVTKVRSAALQVSLLDYGVDCVVMMNKNDQWQHDKEKNVKNDFSYFFQVFRHVDEPSKTLAVFDRASVIVEPADDDYRFRVKATLIEK